MHFRHHPIRKLTAQLQKHDAFKRQNMPRIAVYYLKLFLQEPFRFWEQVKNRAQIKNHQLSGDPVFIIGHWRSGTSFMQYLMGCDPQFGYLNKFEVVFPEVFLESEDLLKSLAQRIPQTFSLTKDARDMSINLDWDSPSELEIALTTMVSPASPHWGHIFPQEGNEYFNKYLFFDEISPRELRLWRRDYAYLIKKISLKNEGRQVLVKSPGNTARIKKLLELYPGARFIFLHRNPYDVFYSSQKLWHTLLDNLALQDFGRRQMVEQIIAIYKRLMERYLQQRALIPAGRLAEVRFADFVANPLEELSKVYNRLGIDGYDRAEPHIRSFLVDQPEGQSGSYNYEKRAIQRINREWKFAFNEWKYPMHRPKAVNIGVDG